MKTLDIYIGVRYKIYIVNRYNVIRYKEVFLLSNPALTEAVYYILLSLTTPLHGYGIMQNAEALSNGRVRLAPGTLYGALNTLLERGWIEAVGQGGPARKKEYVITPFGRVAVLRELERLRELVRNGEELTGGWQHESQDSI